MSPVEVIEAVRAQGVTLALKGHGIWASPAASVTAIVRDLVAANRSALIAALRPVDLSDVNPQVVARHATMVMCMDCRHLALRQGMRPDGWCRTYGVDTWQQVPFNCGGFERRRDGLGQAYTTAVARPDRAGPKQA